MPLPLGRESNQYARPVTDYWLGLSGPAGFELSVQLDRRSYDRIRHACAVVGDVLELGIVDVLRANAAAVLELLAEVDAHIEAHGVNRGPWDSFMFMLRTTVTNWLTSWGAYREHCLARHPEGPQR